MLVATSENTRRLVSAVLAHIARLRPLQMQTTGPDAGSRGLIVAREMRDLLDQLEKELSK